MRLKKLSIEENLKVIYGKISAAKEKSPRKDEKIDLVVVSKHHTIEEIIAAKNAGAVIFGENRVQELLPKAQALSPVGYDFHLIGHLQTNKVRQIINQVSLIQSVDSFKLAAEINKRAAQIGSSMDILIQVNMAHEDQKFGISPGCVEELISDMAQMKNIRVKGLMFIAPNFEDKEETRPYFREMYKLFESLKEKSINHIDMDILSMGMSGDYDIAIEEGANMVRIGSAVFK